MTKQIVTFFAFTACFATSAVATCVDVSSTNSSGPFDLKIVSPMSRSGTNAVSVGDVSFQLDKTNLVVRFEIAVPEKQWNVKSALSPGEYPFQHDVVEVFVSAENALTTRRPYYEFELSPLNQTFNVKVDQGKSFVNDVHVGSTTKVQKNVDGWVGEFLIPLDYLGWSGRPEDITVNAFAIFGQSLDRTYWSIFLPPQTKPQFHQPQFFRQLFCAPAQPL